MKTIGLIGGMSWESTVTYYQVINETVKAALGGYHSAKLLMYSVDFAEIEASQARDDWDTVAAILTDAACRLERAGADFIILGTNTMHTAAPQMQAALHIPMLHIADATAAALRQDGVRKVALLGTKYTMTADFYKAKIQASGIEVIIPTPADIEVVNRVIYKELCLGVIRDESRAEFVRIIGAVKAMGAEAVILGCTEIGLLVGQQDSPLPVYDTTQIHARIAARTALGE